MFIQLSMFSHPLKTSKQTACIRDKEITIASVRKERCHFQIFADVSSVQRFVPVFFVSDLWSPENGVGLGGFTPRTEVDEKNMVNNRAVMCIYIYRKKMHYI